MTSPVDPIDSDALVAAALADASTAGGVAFGLGAEPGDQPFATEAVYDRLAELDAVWERPSPGAVTFARRPSADPARVAPEVRQLPGGDAFAELFGPSGAVTLGPSARAKELYRRVAAFLARLRDGIFGFRREVLAGPDPRAEIRSALDSDVKLDVDGRSVGEPAVTSLDHALVTIHRNLADALAVFCKVVEIVAGIIKAASNPLSAVRALWKGLNALYEELVRQLTGTPG